MISLYATDDVPFRIDSEIPHQTPHHCFQDLTTYCFVTLAGLGGLGEIKAKYPYKKSVLTCIHK